MRCRAGADKSGCDAVQSEVRYQVSGAFCMLYVAFGWLYYYNLLVLWPGNASFKIRRSLSIMLGTWCTKWQFFLGKTAFFQLNTLNMPGPAPYKLWLAHSDSTLFREWLCQRYLICLTVWHFEALWRICDVKAYR